MPEEIREHGGHTDPKPSPPPPKRGLISRKRQLVFLSFMILLAAKGLVGIGEVAFVILSYIYLYEFISRFAFPRKQNEQKRRLSNPKNKLFQAYFLATAIIGLLFPICYIGDGLYRGDIHGVRAAAPHLFLLSGQAFTEPIGFSDRFATPIGILGPVFYNARRIFALLDWVKAEFSDTQRPGGPVRLYGGRAIASVNTVMWFYNLFGLLLPVFLPRSCEIYFSADDNKVD
ncbi:unnamed protein product [Brassica rapa]|uniref:DUF7733 domain-containing protein n=1 Tax=Brassica campestris TaxID=3711 RepID=A0A3P5XUV2_BRACM|nr:unnamed protein product [Brassica rapa]VDC58707.1 unnamed protein product [Brassica rapa]